MEKDLLGKFYLQNSDDWKQFLLNDITRGGLHTL